MDEILFEKAAFGGYKPETVDEYVDKSQALIVELGQKVSAMTAQAEEYQRQSDKFDEIKRGYENQLNTLRATVDQQQTELGALTAKLAEAQHTAEGSPASDEDLTAANALISKLHGQLAEYKEKEAEETAKLKEVLQAVNADLAATRAELDAARETMSQMPQRGGQDDSLTSFIGKFNQDFTEIFEKAETIANEYRQSASDEMDALKRQAQEEAAAALADANDSAAAIIRASEEQAQSIHETAQAEHEQVKKQAAAELAQAKADASAIIDGALYEGYMLELEAARVKESAESKAQDQLANAEAEAEEIAQNASEILDAAKREAAYKIQLAEERAQTILNRAREKTEKNLASAKAEYNKIRELTERTLQNYRRLSEPGNNMDAIMEQEGAVE